MFVPYRHRHRRHLIKNTFNLFSREHFSFDYSAPDKMIESVSKQKKIKLSLEKMGHQPTRTHTNKHTYTKHILYSVCNLLNLDYNLLTQSFFPTYRGIWGKMKYRTHRHLEHLQFYIYSYCRFKKGTKNPTVDFFQQ
jgi:hypothetical protein